VLVVFGWPAGLLCFFLFLFLYIYIYIYIYFFLREFVLWFLVVDRKRETEEKIEEKCLCCVECG